MGDQELEFDTYDLDEYIEQYDHDQALLYAILGRKVSWHGSAVGTVVKLNNDRLAIELPLECVVCGVEHKILVKSGLHNGAFCYVCDIDGRYIANLRDQLVACCECSPRNK